MSEGEGVGGGGWGGGGFRSKLNVLCLADFCCREGRNLSVKTFLPESLLAGGRRGGSFRITEQVGGDGLGGRSNVPYPADFLWND